MENLYAKAKLFQELQEVVRNKPALINKKKKAIAEMEQKVAELEKVPEQQAYSILNPKRYLSKCDPVAAQKEIERLKYEIISEQRALEELETLTPIEVVDVAAIQNEAQAIIDEQEKVLDQLAKNIVEAQRQYFALVNEYSEHYHHVKNFRNDVVKRLQAEERVKNTRDYGPSGFKVEHDPSVKKDRLDRYYGIPYKIQPTAGQFHLQMPYTHSSIVRGHKQKIVDYSQEILPVYEMQAQHQALGGE